jgi:hypothetical protein
LTVAGQRVEIGGKGRHQRLAFAGAHLGDAAVVERQAADQLHVEVAHLERAPGGFAHHGEGLGREGIDGLALGQPLAEFAGFRAQGCVAQHLHGGFQRSSLAHRRFIATNDAFIATAEEPRQEIEHLEILERNFNADSYLEPPSACGPGILRIDPSSRNWFRPRVVPGRGSRGSPAKSKVSW